MAHVSRVISRTCLEFIQIILHAYAIILCVHMILGAI